MVPIEMQNYNPGLVYKCPMYKTLSRSGDLTGGVKSNFIMQIDIKTLINPDYWIKRGVACIC